MVSRSESLYLFATLFAAIAVTILIEMLLRQKVTRTTCVIALLCCLVVLVRRALSFKDQEIQKRQEMVETAWAIYDKENPINDMKGLWVSRNSIEKKDLLKTIRDISHRWEQETTVSHDVGAINSKNVNSFADEYLSEESRATTLEWLQHERRSDLITKYNANS
jgi:hypothetical protein